MSDKDIKIELKTLGAAQAAQQVARVEDSIERLGDQARQTGQELEMPGTRPASEQLDNLAVSSGKVSAASVSMRSNITQVGYQVQDMAVQIGAGTSAMQSFGQQAPQLLSAFGPWGVVAGTAVAVAAPLITSLFKIGTAAAGAKANMDQLTDAIAESNKRLIQGLTLGLDQQQERLELSAEKIGVVAEAERKAAMASLTNDEKILAAKKLIAEALGLQIDKYKEIEKQAELAAQKRKLEAEQAIERENERAAKARQATEIAGAALNTEMQKQRALQKELAKSEQDLNRVYGRQDELLRKSNQKAGLFDFNARQEKRIATKQLEDPALKNEITAQEGQVKAITEALDAFEGQSGTINQANVKLQELISAETTINQERETAIKALEDQLATDDTVAQAETVAQKMEAQAEEIKGVISNFSTNNERGKEAVKSMTELASDGQIQVTEQAKFAENFRTMIGLLQSGQAEYNGNVSTLITMFQQNQIEQARIKKDLQDLQKAQLQMAREKK